MIKYLIFAVLLILNSSAYAQKFTAVKDIEQIEKLLIENSSKINTIVSDFIQEKHLAFIDEVIISEGKFWLKDNNSIRWEYYEPFSHTIIIHDNKFMTKDDRGRVSSFNVNSNPVFKEINNLIVSSARGDLISDEKFVLIAFENESSYLLKMTPVDENVKQVINNTELYFDKKNLSVTKVVMIENDDDYTVISFKNRQFNVPVENSIFDIN